MILCVLRVLAVNVVNYLVRGIKMRTIMEVYKCDNCGGIYIRNNTGTRCAVIHSAGECCHYKEKRLNESQMSKISAIINENPIK